MDAVKPRPGVSKKWLNATFSSFTGFASRISSRAAKPARYENLWVFIRSDVCAVRAGIKLKGQAYLNNPMVYRQAVTRFYRVRYVLY